MQMAQMNNSLAQAGEEAKACIINNFKNPEYAPITPYLPAPENNFMPTVEQMAVEKIPTATEAKLLAKYHKDGMHCRVEFFNKLDSAAPMLTQVFRESTAKQDTAIMQLVKRKISWGKALEKIQQYTLEGQQKLAMAGQQIQSNFQAMHQSELAQRQAAMKDLSNWAMEQQRINAMSMPQPHQPVMIDCDRFGNGFSCTQW
jgi:hypothetical protein